MSDELANARFSHEANQDKAKFALEAFSTVAKVQQEAWRAASEAKLTLAKAAHEDAKTAYTQTATADLAEQVKAKALAVDRLKAEYFHLSQNEYKAARKIEHMERRIKDAFYLYQWQHLSPSVVGSAWSGILYLISLSSETSSAVSHQPLTPEQLSVDNFTYHKQAVQDPPDTDTSTLYDLIHWMRTHNYMPKSGRPVAKALAGIMDGMVTNAQEEIAHTQKAITEIKAGVIADYNPLKILALPHPNVS